MSIRLFTFPAVGRHNAARRIIRFFSDRLIKLLTVYQIEREIGREREGRGGRSNIIGLRTAEKPPKPLGKDPTGGPTARSSGGAVQPGGGGGDPPPRPGPPGGAPRDPTSKRPQRLLVNPMLHVSDDILSSEKKTNELLLIIELYCYELPCYFLSDESNSRNVRLLLGGGMCLCVCV